MSQDQEIFSGFVLFPYCNGVPLTQSHRLAEEKIFRSAVIALINDIEQQFGKQAYITTSNDSTGNYIRFVTKNFDLVEPIKETITLHKLSFP